MKNGDIILFNSSKNLKYVKALGQGGMGTTHLFEDETTNMLFAIKKYEPISKDFLDEYYSRFVEEIKLLFKISHPNIVRIYNYYLYPDKRVGFLQMEYIEGTSIDQYDPMPWDKWWDEIFSETVVAFEYLESKGILHRDIRPANIMIDSNGCVKIIDFGFGKELENTGIESNSVILNWPVTEMPDEIKDCGEYNFRTEIYFLGKLFSHIVKNVDDFQYDYILQKMVEKDPSQRYQAFKDITGEIHNGVLAQTNYFSDKQKEIYQEFSYALCTHIINYRNQYVPNLDISNIVTKLADVIRKSSLERYLQNNEILISCFILGLYRFSRVNDIEVQTITNFYKMLISLPDNKKELLISNLYTRLGSIKILEDEVEIPF